MGAFFSDLVGEVVYIFVEMAPYLLLGFTVAGILSVVVKKRFIARHVGKPGISAVVKASVLGVPLPLCSCGVVPTAAYFKRAGASRPAVTSFLISTPQTGVDSIIATYGMLGPIFAVFRPIAALVTGIAGGVVSLLTDRSTSAPFDDGADQAEREQPEDTEETEPRTFRDAVRGFLRYAYVEAIDDIAVQFLFGVVVAGLISTFIPTDFFSGRVFGSGLPAMLLMVVVGIPMYVCSTSSIPIAVALIAKGLSPGAAYVFLVAGPATNAATLAVLTRVLGKRQTLMYVLTLIVGSLAFGPLMEFVTGAVGWTPPSAVAGAGHAAMFGALDYAIAIAFFALIAAALVRRWRPNVSEPAKPRGNTTSTQPDGSQINGFGDRFTAMQVEGMTCHHCAANVEDAVGSIDGVTNVRVELKEKRVYFELRSSDEKTEAIARAIRNAGYEPIR